MRRAAARGDGVPEAERSERGEGPPRLKKTVMVTGGRGQLAGAIVDEYTHDADVRAYGHGDLDISDFDAVMARVQADRPDLIINCAAYTNVDKAEEEPDVALNTNAFAVRVLARAAQEAGATLVHYSTDFVFDGRSARPYVEEDAPNPQSVYAQSKLLGEWFASEAPRAFVLRVESLFGGTAAKSSVDRIVQAIADGREATVFSDRVLSPSYVVDVATATRAVVVGGDPGLYHCVGTGHATWYDVAVEIARVMHKEREARLRPVSVAEMSLRASRPQFAALSNDKLRRIVDVPTWQDALRRYLNAL